ncbi:MAG: hypothetical protein HKO59_15700 [Phycisphaerales bacterium]|nr:hypothetical protein [Phycisphaerae bacterium]NNF44289.1 hypothetical protein [Phycisphaerales bacterium]NNM27399.1 hypothetical protein [Phycisphaerales bacterium]
METATHQRLKQLALAFTREQGCAAAAPEVRCPISRYRVDVAGYADPPPRRRGRDAEPEARTIVIECKQTRGDFLRETRDAPRLLKRRDELTRFACLLQRRIQREEPHLRHGETALFAEFDEWRFESSRLPAYHAVQRELARIDEQLHGQTKFHLMAKYRLADRLYLAAPRGLIRRREVPPGWGLLEATPTDLRRRETNADLFGDSLLTPVVPAPRLATPPRRRQRLLRNIAVAASGRLLRTMSVG